MKDGTTSAATRVGLFVAGLVVLFGGAFVAGGAIDPEIEEGESVHQADGMTSADRDGGHRAAESGNASTPARIAVAARRFEPGVGATLAFRVVDREGRTIEDFDVEHERSMHVMAVRRDLTGYQHVHPRRTADGGWAVRVAFPDSGPHRVYADFVSRGEPYTLSADVDVSGRFTARPLPAASTVAEVGDGYAVAVVRDGAERRFTVSKAGRPVDDIEPYLGARGHLVAISEGKLAFQHVHPQDRATEGREIRFDVELARPGRYRLFLQFKHDGEVRTAAFTERVGDGGDAHREDDHGH